MHFKSFKTALQANFQQLSLTAAHFFVTDVSKEELWDTYLNTFPEDIRQEYNCNCCRSFITHYGNVVVVDDSLNVKSLWDFDADEFTAVAQALDKLVVSKKIRDVFVTKENKLGTDSNVAISEKYLGRRWEHLYLELPRQFVSRANDSEDSLRGEYRMKIQVFERGLKEISKYALETVQDLINQNTLYRGAEFKHLIDEFLKHKVLYAGFTDEHKKNYAWLVGMTVPENVAKLRNVSIGTLLTDLSEGKDLETAVTAFERMMAPSNYKRPTALVTKAMLDAAEKTIGELGLLKSLERRFATNDDISVKHALFVYREPSAGLFGQLKEDVIVDPRPFKNHNEIAVADFISGIIPQASMIEVLVENRHAGNFASLIAPVHSEEPTLFKWDNGMSWSYRNAVADSMKERVKEAGGKVEGALRFSIMWNEDGRSRCDLDAHADGPNGTHISFRSFKGHENAHSGSLDVDMIRPSTTGVENIIWTNQSKMPYGDYKLSVDNYDGGPNTGFKAEVEFEGQIHSFEYAKRLSGRTEVAIVTYSKEGFSIKSSLIGKESAPKSQEIWGIGTSKFHKVNLITKSPNFWDDNRVGNEHLFFIIDKVHNNELVRGFFNEFLKPELDQHRKVFEILAGKIQVKPADVQLSGLGFSSTKQDEVILRVTDHQKKTRVYNVKF